MRTALAILGALLLVPAVLGFVAGFGLAIALPWLGKRLEREAAKARRLDLRTFEDLPPLRKGSGDRPTTPRPDFPDKHYYRRTRPS